ncbi:phage holin family protein [Pseudomonas lurida]|uniref:phage holin family protein n=1 Tax=Pseudomonas lurida TaxID=244566 RepID=UPI00164964D4|nr:phage holin family protein [Pseudomonas lurida]MBC3233996.1 phage holin family protein [Pseudomonas lurida]
MVDPWTLIAGAVCGAICIRIAMYRRDGARYRPGVSWLAYALAVATGCEWLSILMAVLFAKPTTAVSPYLLIVLLVLAVLVYRAGGNVARIVRMN